MWTEQDNKLEREFTFKDFSEVFAFMSTYDRRDEIDVAAWKKLDEAAQRRIGADLARRQHQQVLAVGDPSGGCAATGLVAIVASDDKWLGGCCRRSLHGKCRNSLGKRNHHRRNFV